MVDIYLYDVVSFTNFLGPLEEGERRERERFCVRTISEVIVVLFVRFVLFLFPFSFLLFSRSHIRNIAMCLRIVRIFMKRMVFFFLMDTGGIPDFSFFYYCFALTFFMIVFLFDYEGLLGAGNGS